MSGKAKDQRSLIVLEDERYAAMLRADTSALEPLLHPDQSVDAIEGEFLW